jgi:hypothetical protein
MFSILHCVSLAISYGVRFSGISSYSLRLGLKKLADFDTMMIADACVDGLGNVSKNGSVVWWLPAVTGNAGLLAIAWRFHTSQRW